MKKKILKIKITAIFFYQFVLNIQYYRLYDLQIQKYVKYAGDMNINRNKKKLCRNIKILIFFRKQNCENIFVLVQCFFLTLWVI